MNNNQRWISCKTEIFSRFQYYRRLRDKIIKIERHYYPESLKERIFNELLPALEAEDYKLVLRLCNEIEDTRLKWFYRRL